MPGDGFNGVRRTGRLKPAGGAQHRRNPTLVESNDLGERLSHSVSACAPRRPACLNTASQTSRRSAGLTASASRRGKITISYPAANRFVRRANSRKILFARFLLTAVPNRFPTMTATRVSRSPFVQVNNAKTELWRRRPIFLTRSISELCRRKRRRGTGGPVIARRRVCQTRPPSEPALSRVGGPTLFGHSSCSCVCESRDRAFA